MQLNIYCYNAIEKKTHEYIEQVDDLDQQLLSICHRRSVTNIFPRYFPFDGTYMHEDEFPYIIRNGVYLWGVPIKSVTIREFLNTFPECIKDGIYIDTGVPAAGGRDYIFGRRAWELCHVLVSRKYPEIGWTVELISKLKAFLESCDGSDLQEKTEPHVILAMASNYFGAFRGKEFSSREVAELLNIENYRAEKILVKLGYRKNLDTNKYYLLEDDRENVWDLALKVASYNYDNTLRYNSGSTEFIADK